MISIKKVHCDIRDKLKDKSHITNITCSDDQEVVISLLKNELPLIKSHYENKEDENVIIKGDVKSINKLHDVNIKFVGKLRSTKNEYVVVPIDKFELIHVDEHENHKSTVVSTEDGKDLHSSIVDVISEYDPKICKHQGCFDLVGFVELCEFNLIVQYICHHTASRKIFIMRNGFTRSTKTIHSISVFGCIDFKRVCKINKISKDTAKKSIISSVTSNGQNQIYFISTSGTLSSCC